MEKYSEEISDFAQITIRTKQPMSTYDFLMLSQIEQLQAIMTSSKFLQKKVSLGSYFELHSLSRFYIEIEKEFFTKRILNISIFSEGTKLDKYVGEIAL